MLKFGNRAHRFLQTSLYVAICDLFRVSVCMSVCASFHKIKTKSRNVNKNKNKTTKVYFFPCSSVKNLSLIMLFRNTHI